MQHSASLQAEILLARVLNKGDVQAGNRTTPTPQQVSRLLLVECSTSMYRECASGGQMK
jgi:hypothetical protein